LSRIATVTDPSAGVTRYTYDIAGNLKQTDLPNGTHELRQYDTLNRLVYLENNGPSGVISSYRYILGPTGRRDAVVENDGRRVDYGYDALDRLTREAIVHAALGNRTINYTYDPVGNRKTRNDSVEGLTTSTYDNNDRLLTETLAGQVTQYTYDDNGNTLSKFTSISDRAVYTWDSRNRLVTADVWQSTYSHSDYRYDADGIRVSQSVDGTETRYLIDTVQAYAQVLVEYRSSGLLVASYVHGNDLISQRRGVSTSIYHADGLGNVRGITNASGLMTDRYIYDAFGLMLLHSGSTSNSYLYAGEQRDTPTGLDYLRARYLNSAMGRFYGRDPLEGQIMQPETLHRFSYGHVNPVMFNDPSGLLASLIESMQSFAIRSLVNIRTGFKSAAVGAAVGGALAALGEYRGNLAYAIHRYELVWEMEIAFLSAGNLRGLNGAPFSSLVGSGAQFTGGTFSGELLAVREKSSHRIIGDLKRDFPSDPVTVTGAFGLVGGGAGLAFSLGYGRVSTMVSPGYLDKDVFSGVASLVQAGVSAVFGPGILRFRFGDAFGTSGTSASLTPLLIDASATVSGGFSRGTVSIPRVIQNQLGL
jgi:RHS repeat-associated protein